MIKRKEIHVAGVKRTDGVVMASERSWWRKGTVSNQTDFCISQAEMKQYCRVLSKGVTGSGLSFRRLILVAMQGRTVVEKV